jgi:hypothetical protein
MFIPTRTLKHVEADMESYFASLNGGITPGADMSTNDGGQAFPDDYNSGLSMRDYFAAKALAGLLGAGEITLKAFGEVMSERNISIHQAYASAAYAIANAMLAERHKP